MSIEWCEKPMVGESKFIDFSNKEDKSINLNEIDIGKNQLKDYDIINNDFEMVEVID